MFINHKKTGANLMLKFNQLFLGLVSIILCVGLMGCGGATTTENKPPANTATKPADTKPAENKPADSKPADSKPATNSDAAKAESIGVPECDEYIKKYEACLMSKVPEAQRAAFKTSYDTLKKSWKEAAATPQGKAGLAQGCKMALDQAKSSFASFGCEW